MVVVVVVVGGGGDAKLNKTMPLLFGDVRPAAQHLMNDIRHISVSRLRFSFSRSLT